MPTITCPNSASQASPCFRCGSRTTYTASKGPHVGLYCDCGKWLRWLPQGRAVTTMPFGIHSGSAIASLPLGYLDFVLCNVDLSGSLYRALADEFERRGKSE